MQTRANELNQTHIHASHRVYLLFGQEIMLIEQSLKFIRRGAKQHHFNERIRFDIDAYFNWNLLLTELQTQSLFSTKRLIECHISSLTNKTEQLTTLLKSVPDDVILILIINELKPAQKNTKWFKTINKLGVIIGHYELNNQQTLTWLNRRMKLLGLVPNQEMVQILLLHNENNLLALWQELQKLILEYPDGNINIEQYKAHTIQQSHYKPYGLINAALMGNTRQMLKIYYVLKDNNIEILYLINSLINELNTLSTIATNAKESGLAQAISVYHFWGAKETLVKKALHRHTAQNLQKMLLSLGQLERSSKGQGYYNVHSIWHGLLALLLNLSGQKIWIP